MSGSNLLRNVRSLLTLGLLVATAAMLTPPVGAAESGSPAFRPYRCLPGTVDSLAGQLQRQFGGNPRVRIVPDPQRSQVLVFAPPEVQAEIAAQVPATPAAPPEQGAPVAAAPVAPARAQEGRQEIPLHQLSCQEMEVALVRALGTRLTPLADSQPRSASYQLRLPGGAAMRLTLDAQTSRVRLEGPAAAVHSVLQLIQALDVPQRESRTNTEVVAVDGATAGAVQPVVEVLGAQRPRGDESSARSPSLRAAAAIAAAQPSNSEAADLTADALGALGQVKVEVLEGLDVLVIRGDQKDVQRVVAIVEQIEQLAQVTKPAIDIVQLQHVESVALGTLLTQVYKDIFSNRSGSISITALGKPNALLLVGNPETIAMVRELVQRLDQPVAPATQMQAFHLKSLPAETAKKSVDDYFAQQQTNASSTQNSGTATTGGLAPRVTVVADFRTNSLIVRANPRELAEVAALLARLDGGTNESIKDMRVFRLKNSIASKMVEVLRDAITGPIYGQRGQQGNSSAPGSSTNNDLKSTRLQFIPLDSQQRQVLRSGILTDVQLTADNRTNSILVNASAESMPLIEALIHELDQPPEVEAQVKVFPLQNGDATAMCTMLGTIFGQSSTSGDSAAVRTGTPVDETTLVGLQFAPDTRTNCVIATGSSGALVVVEAILRSLDNSDIRTRHTTVYRLKNSPALDVADAINQYLERQREADTTNVTERIITAYEQVQREVIVVPEPVSNNLIVSATPRFFDEINRLVMKLDQRPPMVMIQVLIGQVDLQNANELGVELGLQDSVLFDRSAILGTAPATTLSPGYLFNGSNLGNSANNIASSSRVGGQGISSLDVGRSNSELGFGGLVLSASSESVSVLIRALQMRQRLQVLSRPQVMTLDNQTAMIHVGQDVPTITGSSSTQYGGIINEITPRSVGLILNVTPRVSPDRLVMMEVQAEKSKVGNVDDGIPVAVSEGEVVKSPKIDITNTRTVVSVLDGQTVVLGGLIQTEDQHVERRVPYLADIPVVGLLFQYKKDYKQRSELLFILTPHIVYSTEEAEAIKRMETARMHWCLCDVMALHDGDGLGKTGPTWYDGRSAVIYPDLDPTLKTMQELTPPSEGVPSPTMPEAIPAPNGVPGPTMGPMPQPQLQQPQPMQPQPMQPMGAAPAMRNPVAQQAAPPRANRPSAAPNLPGAVGTAQPVSYNAPVTYPAGPAPGQASPPVSWPPRFEEPGAPAGRATVASSGETSVTFRTPSVATPPATWPPTGVMPPTVEYPATMPPSVPQGTAFGR